ncbi:paraquat-inducible protein A [Endozoicomonas montiporae]|uniref:Paraquat-inducible protein A n=1 Tax=Endozoicomonas montiporae CL-33 TaxID=570277 RepID=A0A142BIV3_9GAMM|nr:paraquat-inducible protein A [Endozoicomonas montiporae]AMO58679.1 paraquat-inducible protein A [Endozoicomonas montiporae CL-33]
MKADSLHQPADTASQDHHHAHPVDSNITLCPDCDLVIREVAYPNPTRKLIICCPRCNRNLREYHPDGLIKTLSWVITGLLLFLPANIFPVLQMEILDHQEASTIWDGVVTLYQEDLQGVALLVFSLAILVPGIRLLILLFVMGALFLKKQLLKKQRPLAGLLFRRYLQLGEWGMVEIYLLGVLVAVIKLADMAIVHPGAGLLCFVGLMAAELGISICMDEQEVWEQLEGGYER